MKILSRPQTRMSTSAVHEPGIYEGKVRSMGGSLRECPTKRANRLEGARLMRAHLAAGHWTQETVSACEALADRILGHTAGCRSSEFRTKLSDMEIPCSHLGDVSKLSPIVYMVP